MTHQQLLVLTKKKYSDEVKEKQKKESALEITSLSTWKRTHQTAEQQFSAEKTKKNHRYLAIKLTHVDTLYSLKHSFT